MSEQEDPREFRKACRDGDDLRKKWDTHWNAIRLAIKASDGQPEDVSSIRSLFETERRINEEISRHREGIRERFPELHKEWIER